MSTGTIAAIGTGLTNSGISIIRISGEKSLDIINKIFDNSCKLKPNTIIYGNITKEKDVIDNVLVSYFKAPKSFTGEDVVEVNCHGGVEITKKILEYILESGAVLAEPGEFSKRAFLNGKMDLAKAEAIIDLINAKNKISTNIFASQVNGKLSNKIKQFREELVELLAHISVSIDYPEYDYDEVENNNVIELIDKKLYEISNLLDTYEQGKYIKNGVRVAILGKTNVGKSSLLNKLSGNDKAIVTDIAGTTRDIVEETINIGNLILNISDTAGIRDTDDIIEKLGVEKSIKVLDEVDLVFYMLSTENELDNSDIEILSKIKNKGLKYIVLINKSEKLQNCLKMDFKSKLVENNIDLPIFISVEENIGIEDIKNKIENIFNKNHLDYSNELVITNERHKELLKKSIESLNDGKREILNGMPIDIISIYIKNATKYLGEIIGEDVTVDVTKKIFEKFCLGK